jgi:Replication protein P
MDKISDIVSNSEFLARRDNQDVERDLDPLTVMVVNRLFNFFEASCPGYDKQFGGNDTKLKTQKINFARAFMDEGISRIEQVEHGVKKCRRESPINTPTVGQFLNWCTPSAEELGLWPKDKAYKKAMEINRQFADIPQSISPEQLAIIKHAIQETGSFDLRNKSEAQTKPIFERNYEIAVRDFIKGNLKTIPKGIEDKEKENIELRKQEEIKKGFEQLRGYEDCMPVIRKILGMNADGTVPTNKR